MGGTAQPLDPEISVACGGGGVLSGSAKIGRDPLGGVLIAGKVTARTTVKPICPAAPDQHIVTRPA
jgi:hypothetical protein